MIPDFSGTRLLEAATYDPIAPSKNNVEGAVSIITNLQGGSDGAKKCDIQNLKWGGILSDQN